MKKIAYILSFCGLLLVSSCTTLKKTATTADVENNVLQHPVVVNTIIKEKVTATKTWYWKPFHWGELKYEIAKGNLVAETLKEHEADVLLEPQFIFTRTPFGERVLTVTGFPAIYKDFRNATPQDLELINSCKEANEKVKYNKDETFLKKFLFMK